MKDESLLIYQQLIESIREFSVNVVKSEKELRALLSNRRETPYEALDIAKSNCTVYNAYLYAYLTYNYFDGLTILDTSKETHNNLEIIKDISEQAMKKLSEFYKEIKELPFWVWAPGNTEEQYKTVDSIADAGLDLCKMLIHLSAYLKKFEALLLVELSGKTPEIFENKYYSIEKTTL